MTFQKRHCKTVAIWVFRLEFFAQLCSWQYAQMWFFVILNIQHMHHFVFAQMFMELLQMSNYVVIEV